MALPTPSYPADEFSGNEQSTVNDGAPSTLKYQALDYNKLSAEIKAIEATLRAGLTGVVQNNTGGALTEGTYVRFSGFDVTSGFVTVVKALADSENNLADGVLLANAPAASASIAGGLVYHRFLGGGAEHEGAERADAQAGAATHAEVGVGLGDGLGAEHNLEAMGDGGVHGAAVGAIAVAEPADEGSPEGPNAVTAALFLVIGEGLQGLLGGQLLRPRDIRPGKVGVVEAIE